MSRIFLSYRQVDQSIAQRIQDRLATTFGEADVVTEIADMPADISYRRHFSNALNEFETIIIIVGQDWDQLKEASNGPNPQYPDDFTRIQVGTALSTTDKILVPILVNRAVWPHEDELPNDLAAIVNLRPATVRDGKRAFERDMEVLIHERLEPVHRRYDVPDEDNMPAVTSRGLGVALMMLLTVVPLGIIFAIACNLVFGVSGALVEVVTGTSEPAAQITVIPTVAAGEEIRVSVAIAEGIAQIRTAPTSSSAAIDIVDEVEALTAVAFSLQTGDADATRLWLLVELPQREGFYGWVDGLYFDADSLGQALSTLVPFAALNDVETNFPIGRDQQTD